MQDYVEDTKKNLLEFYEDSVGFMQKCSKPDKKGKQVLRRIRQDCHILRYWFRYHGICWIRHQARVHPNQQDPSELIITNICVIALLPTLSSPPYSFSMPSFQLLRVNTVDQ